jgi:hypothetical protein
MTPETWLKYKLHRQDETVRAAHAMQWLRSEITASMHAYIKTLPYSDQPELFSVPGIGTLKFEIKDDSDHDPYDGDGQAFQWISTRDHYDSNRKYDAGTTIMDNCYSLDHWDGNSVWCVRFDKKAGSRIEDRRDYWRAQGYAKHVAWVKARDSIIRECRYWRSVAKGDTSFVGYVVTLLAPEDVGMNDTIMEEDSCWGYEYDSKDTYLLGCMNDAAQGMVEKHWKSLYGKLPPAFVEGVHPLVDAAWKAWHTAMTASDGDRELADPIYISTLRGKRGTRRVRTEWGVQVRP